MIHLKYFENKENYREVDLKQLYKNMFIYRKNIGYNFVEIQDMFESDILPKLLKNKYIEFHKIKNPIDGEIVFNTKGVVEWVKLDDMSDIIIKLKNDNTFWQIPEKSSQVIRIYDSEPLSIEKDINRYEEERKLKEETEKYNL